MKYITVSDELYHHGVKGMKWGVRRKRRKLEKDVNYLTSYEKKLRREVETLADRYTITERSGHPNVTLLQTVAEKYNLLLLSQRFLRESIDDLNKFDVEHGIKATESALENMTGVIITEKHNN